jgi:hypothetical protein
MVNYDNFQDWALGAMYTKITVALTFMGPDWWLKLAIEQLYQNGLRNINLSHVVKVSRKSFFSFLNTAVKQLQNRALFVHKLCYFSSV